VNSNNSGCETSPGSGNSCQPNCQILIEYIQITCGPLINGIQFKSASFFGSCYQGISGYAAQSTDYKEAQQALLNSIGGSAQSIVHPAACRTMAEVTYPNPSPCYYFWPEGPLAGQVQSMVNLGIPSPILELLACDGENCCKLDYTYDVNTGRYTNVSFPQNIVCPSLPPTIITKTFECLDRNNKPVTYTGTVTFPYPCESYCNAALNTLFKTSNNADFRAFPDLQELSLSPIPAKDFITFSNIDNVSKIELYNTSGKKIEQNFNLNSKKIDISEIVNGVYFVKVFFNDNGMRSIKIIKE
jgi:hypothetical protein